MQYVQVPVSYTHLDVYKRQDETSTQAAGNTISEAIAAAADVQQNNLFRASSAVNVVLDPGPVSYTHLFQGMTT